MHVLDCVLAGYSTCVVLSNDTDVIVALLYYVPMFRKEGLKELWVRAGRGNTTRFVPLHILHDRHGIDLCKVLPALHSLLDVTSPVKLPPRKQLSSPALKSTFENSAPQLKLALSRFTMRNATW